MTHDLRMPPLSTAMEIAVLVRCIPVQAAADLIEQYAATVAAGARLDASAEILERMERARA